MCENGRAVALDVLVEQNAGAERLSTSISQNASKSANVKIGSGSAHGRGGCVYQKSDSAILVMKTTENRSRCDDSEALNRARERGIFAQRAMNS
jgi:hypothetical protein